MGTEREKQTARRRVGGASSSRAEEQTERVCVPISLRKQRAQTTVGHYKGRREQTI